MVIDCDSCQVAGPACDDCVVTVLLGTPDPRHSPVPLASDHARAIGVLARIGAVSRDPAREARPR